MCSRPNNPYMKEGIKILAWGQSKKCCAAIQAAG